MKTKIQALFIALAILTGATHVLAQGTAFTYQGQLNDNGSPANGNYDLSFTLLNAPTNGTVFGSLTNTATLVTNGLFTSMLDFGGVFNGSNYWLQIAARTNGGGTFTALNPLQPITPTPYAIYAGNATTALTAGTAANANSVAGANITGSLGLAQLPSAVLTNNQSGVTLGGTFNGLFNGNAGGLTNVPATSLNGTIADTLLSSNIVRVSLPNTNVQATAIPVITAGFIIGITNLSGGSGYTNNPLVTVNDTTGSNAVITATFANGSVTSLAVQNAGTHYSANASITIAPPPTSAFQTINAITLFNNPSNIFTGSFVGNAGGLTNLNAANLTGTAANLSVSSNIYLPATTAKAGVIYYGGVPVMHDFGTNNFFVGTFAGNFTMSGTGNSAFGSQGPLEHDTTGSFNTASGQGALGFNTTGNNNTANGWFALLYSSTGNNNTACGFQALWGNSAGNFNTANGANALVVNTTGSFNTANGASALQNNTTASQNTANGYYALFANTTGSNNTANGSIALENNTTGNNNTAVGYQALLNNSIGFQNEAIGVSALRYNTTGNNNSANGMQALYANTTGNNNTASGFNALQDNTTGSDNTASGLEVLEVNSTGNNNTVCGYLAMVSNTTGSDNTANGYEVLESNSTGNYNIAEGYQAGYNITTGSSNIDIGNLGVVTDANIIRIGSGQTQAFIAGVINGNGAGLTNVSLTGLSASSAQGNTANGYQALASNTTGSGNTANGQFALENNTTGFNNAANGENALISNTSGIDNTANGVSALYANTTGTDNTANGLDALRYNITGIFNTADGKEALRLNTNGNFNASVGANSLFNNTSGTNNIALGYEAGFNVVNGNNNIEIGNPGLATDTNIIRIGSGQTQTFIAGVITGNGGGLTNLSPSTLGAGTAAINITGNAATATTASIVTGNIADNQLSANVPLLNATNIFTGTNTFAGTLIANNASNVISGTMSGTFSGDGSGLYNTVTTANYVSAYDTANHLTSIANTFQGVGFGAANLSGWTYIGGGAATFTCPQSGMYLVQYTAEAATTINSATTISLRAFNLATNFETPGSESSVILSVANQATPVSKSFMAYYVSGNAIQIQFTGSNPAAELVGGIGASTYQPSISCTIIRIQ